MNLNQVTLPTSDLSGGIAFYELLGLRLIVNAPPHYARFECPDGDSTLSLHLTENFPTGEGITVYFECDDLDGEYDRLHKAGLNFSLPPTDQSWRWREAHLADPDSNRIILFRAGEDRKNPPWRLEDKADSKGKNE